MCPPNEMFVTTDPLEGWRDARSEVTGQPDKSPASDFGLNASQGPEVEPTRLEGPNVQSPGWNGTGGMESENAAPNKMEDWVNSANKRDQDTHQRLADTAQTPAQSRNDRATVDTGLAFAAGAALASPGERGHSHDELQNRAETSAPSHAKKQQPSQAQHVSHDDLRANLQAAKQEVATRENLHERTPPQTLGAEQAWEKQVPTQGRDW